jgi:glutamate 5-kinase
VVNENDTVSVEEIRVGDNDNLAAHTAALVEADLLILLTDVPGVYDRDPSEPGARLIERADSAAELRPYCFRKKSPESRGGMATKLEAAEKAASYGIPTVIAGGWDTAALEALYAGEPAGTLIAAAPAPLRGQSHWMTVQSRPPGGVVVDAGALAALRRGSSLLPSGVREVVGRFRAGDLVSVLDPAGTERARGIAALGDREVERVKGRHSREVEELLGRPGAAEIIHADKLVRLEEKR